MLHEPGEVLEVAPEPVDLLPGSVDRDRAADLDAPRATVAGALGLTAELLAGEHVEQGHAEDGRGGHGHALTLCPVGPQGPAQEGEVHEVAADPGPDRPDRMPPGEDPDPARDLAHADGVEGVAAGVVVIHADHPGHAPRRGDLGQAEPDAEPAELAGKALRVGQGSVAAGSIAGAAVRLRVRVLPPIGGPPVGANGLLCGCGHRSPFCFRSWLAYRCVPRGAGCSAIRVWVRGCVVVGRSRAGPSCFTMRTAYRKREPRAPGLRKCADR